jgi:Flp pilus assembly protein CpaB
MQNTKRHEIYFSVALYFSYEVFAMLMICKSSKITISEKAAQSNGNDTLRTLVVVSRLLTIGASLKNAKLLKIKGDIFYVESNFGKSQ